MRRHRARVSNLAAGVLAVGLIAAACYLVFGGSLPFSGSPYVLNALFRTQTQIHLPSVVRIGGVDVGQVTAVRRVSGSSTAAVVTMEIDKQGLPIHADATANIRPRLFLEGNFYVDLHPGTPEAPTLPSGATLPAGQTAGPVQLDRVLSALNSDARSNLQTVLQGLGSALNGASNPGQRAAEDPSVRGLTAGQSLNASLEYAAGAFKASAIVNQALLGREPHDLSGAIGGSERVFHALASSQRQLASLVSTFDATMSTLASRQSDLSETIALLPPLLRNANAALGPVNASLPPTRALAKEILPGLRQLKPTIDTALPWVAQTTQLLSPSELGGLVSALSPAVTDTAAALHSTKALLRGGDALARCLIHNVIPTEDAVIQDPPATTGLPVYQEMLQTAVGLAGASENFDGNGRYARASVAGGSDLIQTSSLGTQGPLFGNAVLAPLGTRPAWPGKAPPLRRDVACASNAPPTLNDAHTGAGP